MAVNVETLEKLERRMTLSLPLDGVQGEMQKRLRRLARTLKMDGFRPGKVPMSIVEQRYGPSVRYEVMNDMVGEAFYKAAQEAGLRLAGRPDISEIDGAAEGEMNFEAKFEVLPEVEFGALGDVEVEKVAVEVGQDAVERTLDILRNQRRTFSQRAKDAAVEEGDRVSVDFEGKIDGEPFSGGKAENFSFIVGEGQMLKEFDDAVRGMKPGESKTFPLTFPQDYHGTEVAGKTADFMVTVKKIEAAHLPEVDDAFAKSLGVKDATVEALHADIRKNLEREVGLRVSQRNRHNAIEALVANATLDIPKASVQAEMERMVENTRAQLRAQGIKDVEKIPVPEDVLRPEAERRVRVGLVVSALVEKEKLRATPEQVKAQVEELAASYEKPEELVRFYYADQRRLAEVEGIVIENNVADYVFAHAKGVEKKLSFDELMGRTPPAEEQAAEQA
ncbi:MAG: trigger factor [Ottowia sp.]|nr:trigger factor [Ottowia sp.]